ncbi:calcium/sodium antiporter [Prosthecochloris sp. HL-130-GSB]|jgi:cation:H+ antiporter|uniref:Calcium/sodium antiporter n=1 Tax=Prosthecochloris aestuarii TaxID=1102 RepID=A0A831WS84_PROAE|nr:calcium/sodium antiporter [Prosthecochloris sp. HL-130-GSB]ARM30580.1 conjugal transfer protein TraR [Prosthecochloris sp. HL-130-GSB]MBO8093268.1 calcium/sodium antiporter [Prosthecochloris sp.]HED31390.1 calcium/sodium antiporter [Prosthecochloris aestuarii]
MFLDSVFLVLGLGLLLGGGNFLVTGASALARNLGVSPLVIGLTVVAFGTSAPELSINLLGTLQGQSDISFGNIIGSNIANIGLILGLTALIRPLVIESVIISREIPMLILVSLFALIAGNDILLRSAANVYDRSDGLVFLMLFGVFMYYTVGDVLRKHRDPLVEEAEEFAGGRGLRDTMMNVALFAGGLAALIFGGKLSVDAATAIALALDVPQVIIGLTVVAIGTSLPELVTSLVALFQGKNDIAVGNVVGSNIFNLLLVNGLCSTVRPIDVPAAGGLSDLLVMMLLTLFLLPMSITDGRKIVRWEGAVLLGIYLAYNVWRIAG